MPLLARGYVPVVGSLSTRFRAPANGELTATALVGPEVLGPALANADAGERPRTTVEVSVTDGSGTLVDVTELRFVFVPVVSDAARGPYPGPVGGAGEAAAPGPGDGTR